MREFFRRSLHDSAESQNQKPREVPGGLWLKCPRCRELIYVKELERNRKVCHKCGYHFRLTARERLDLLLDEGSFSELAADLTSVDPLQFVSNGKPYPVKLSEAQQESGLEEAVLCGTGQIEGILLVIAVCDFSFIGASMGSVFGEKVTRAIEVALGRRLPLLTVSASGGARMQEGLYSLMQMAKTAAALARLDTARLPHFSLLTDPTSGGVTASYASLGDVILAEPGAFIGFAGPRLIEQITKQKLPPGAQTAEFLLERGMVDMVVPRRELKTTLGRLLRFYTSPEFQVQYYEF